MSMHGTFSGNPQTEWLTDKLGSDRNMQLLEDFSFTDPEGRIWLAPKGSVVNGASIPRPLWVIVGSPYTDDYRRASIVHDVACDDPLVLRKEADVMFKHACLAGGCTYNQAKLLYAGVRLGAWRRQFIPDVALSRDRLLFRLHFAPTSDELFLQTKFFEIASDLETLDDDASLEAIDAVIDAHIKQNLIIAP